MKESFTEEVRPTQRGPVKKGIPQRERAAGHIVLSCGAAWGGGRDFVCRFIYCTLKFLGLFRAECGPDLFPLSYSEESEKKADASSLQGLLRFLLSLSPWYLAMIVEVP